MKELVEESPNRLNHTKVQALNFGVETVQTSEEQDEDCCVQNSWGTSDDGIIGVITSLEASLKETHLDQPMEGLPMAWQGCLV